MALLTAMATWASTFTVTNDGNKFTITRNGSGRETVYYRTVSLSALAGHNFTEQTGSLIFLENESVRTITVNEVDISSFTDYVNDVYNLMYAIQTSLVRSYRFEVLNGDGDTLASLDRDIEFGKDYQLPAEYVNKSVTDLIYFDDSGNLKSGTGNKYLDIGTLQDKGLNWTKVTDAGYKQSFYLVKTDVFNGSPYVRIYTDNLGMKVHATIFFKQREENDGYQYIQILDNNYQTYDGNDSDGAVNNPEISQYKACFELSKSGVTTDEHYQFFPHRYDFVNKAAEQNAGLSHYSFDHDNNYLYQQKYLNNSNHSGSSGSLIFSPTNYYICVRFDAAGNGDDNWYFKELKARIALVDATAPTVVDNYKVSGGRHSRGNTIYVSVPFNEIVTVSGTPTLSTTWGTLNYLAGAGSNVLTFSGTISNTASGTFTVNSYNGTITDLAGNNLSGTINHAFGTNLQARTFSISYNLAGGSLPSGQSNPTSYTDFSNPITLVNPVRENYEFLGWTGSNGTTPQLNVTIPSGSSGNKSYTANWKLIRYTYDSASKMLTLLRGEFSRDNKWGGDVPTSEVAMVIAYNGVSFTGDCTQLFAGFTNCTAMDLRNANTTNVTNMSLMFSNCSKLNTLYVSGWNTGNVTNMSFMFSGSGSLEQLDLSDWNTGNVTMMSYMFQTCTSLTTLDLSGWDTGNVMNMDGMFSNCSSLTSLDLSGWNTARVDYTYSMFFGCTKLTSLDLSGWNTSNVINMANMFQSCIELKSVNLSGWNINDYVSLSDMFGNCNKLTTIYATPSWDAENVTHSNNMFQRCTKLVGGCGTTFDENHTDKEYARIDRGSAEPGYFTGVFVLTLPANVTASPNPVCTLGGARYYAAGSTVTLTYSGTVPQGYVPVFSVNGTPIEGNTFEMPVGDATITVTISNPPRYIYDSATGKLTLLSGEFSKDDKWGSDVPADAVTSIDATSKVIFTGDCSRLFLNFTSCTSIDLDSVNTANVSNMSNMFSGCSGLTTLNISSWNTAAVTNMERMFSGCSNLATIYAGINWTVENVTSAGNMFSGCTSLVGGMGTTYDANHVGKEYARIDGGPDMPGYFTDPNAVVLMPGDVNGDNVVDIDDVSAIIFIILEKNTIDDFPGNADLDGNGTVDVDDMNAVIHIILTQ